MYKKVTLDLPTAWTSRPIFWHQNFESTLSVSVIPICQSTSDRIKFNGTCLVSHISSVFPLDFHGFQIRTLLQLGFDFFDDGTQIRSVLEKHNISKLWRHHKLYLGPRGQDSGGLSHFFWLCLFGGR